MPLAIPPGTDLSKLPALAPPQGVVPNFIDPESRAHAVLVGSGVLTAVTLVFVIARFYTKAFVTKALGWEDGRNMEVSKFGSLTDEFIQQLVLLGWCVASNFVTTLTN